MSLANELIKSVLEGKKDKGGLAVPKYDNFNTPNNHVGGASNATKEVKNPTAGLDQKVDKKPNSDVGSAKKERGRSMEGPSKKTKKVSEARNPILDQLNISVDNGLLRFAHPGNPSQVYSVEYNQDIHRFLQKTLARHADADTVFQMLLDYHQEGEGQDPYQQVGLAASTGHVMEQGRGSNPVVQALSLTSDGKTLTATSMDGQAAVTVPMSPGLQKNLNAFLTSPEARVDTAAAADKLFRSLAKVQGAQASAPAAAQATGQAGGAVKSQGVAPGAGAGLSLEPMAGQAAGGGYDPRNRMMASVGESAHKTASGEMKTPAVKKDKPAHASGASGKQDDEPTNHGNPGTGREEKGQPKKQFSMNPKDSKGGERGDNAHKKMGVHESLKDLEKLVGRELQLKGTEFGG